MGSAMQQCEHEYDLRFFHNLMELPIAVIYWANISIIL